MWPKPVLYTMRYLRKEGACPRQTLRTGEPQRLTVGARYPRVHGNSVTHTYLSYLVGVVAVLLQSELIAPTGASHLFSTLCAPFFSIILSISWWLSWSLIFGKDDAGISLPRNLHSGSHPSPIRYSNSLSFGVILLTKAWWFWYTSLALACIPFFPIAPIHHLAQRWWQSAIGPNQNGSHAATKLITLPHIGSMTPALKLLYQLSISRSTRMTLASGYAAMRSSANATAGGSELTALQCPRRRSQSARVYRGPWPRNFASMALFHMAHSRILKKSWIEW